MTYRYSHGVVPVQQCSNEGRGGGGGGDLLTWKPGAHVLIFYIHHGGAICLFTPSSLQLHPTWPDARLMYDYAANQDLGRERILYVTIFVSVSRRQPWGVRRCAAYGPPVPPETLPLARPGIPLSLFKVIGWHVINIDRTLIIH